MRNAHQSSYPVTQIYRDISPGTLKWRNKLCSQSVIGWKMKLIFKINRKKVYPSTCLFKLKYNNSIAYNFPLKSKEISHQLYYGYNPPSDHSLLCWAKCFLGNYFFGIFVLNYLIPNKVPIEWTNNGLLNCIQIRTPFSNRARKWSK